MFDTLRRMEPLTASKRSARSLLAAWSSTDYNQIRKAAEQAEIAEAASLFDEERMEIVREAASVLRQWGERGQTGPAVEASLQLLRHLARPTFQGSCSI